MYDDCGRCAMEGYRGVGKLRLVYGAGGFRTRTAYDIISSVLELVSCWMCVSAGDWMGWGEFQTFEGFCQPWERIQGIHMESLTDRNH